MLRFIKDSMMESFEKNPVMKGRPINAIVLVIKERLIIGEEECD